MARAASRVAARRGAGSVGRLVVILSINGKNEFHLTRESQRLGPARFAGGGWRATLPQVSPARGPSSPRPSSPSLPPAGREKREPGWSGLAFLPLLPVWGVWRGREKRAGVMRVLGGGRQSARRSPIRQLRDALDLDQELAPAEDGAHPFDGHPAADGVVQQAAQLGPLS